MFLFYSIHYPIPGKEKAIAESMHRYGELMKKEPGLVFVAPYPFIDEEKGTLLGISIWESQEVFQTAIAHVRSMRSAEDDVSESWEAQPTEVYTRNSVL